MLMKTLIFQSVLDSVERHWLGHWKGLLLGNPWSNHEERDTLGKLTEDICQEMLKITNVRPSTVKLQVSFMSSMYEGDKQKSFNHVLLVSLFFK